MGRRICSFTHSDWFGTADTGAGADDAHKAVDVRERKMEIRGEREERDFIFVGNGLLGGNGNLYGGGLLGRVEGRGR